MSETDVVQRVISADFVGTVEAVATDPLEQVSVSLGVRGEVTSIEVLQPTEILRSAGGLTETIFAAANHAEGVRVLNELALAGFFDDATPSAGPHVLAPLPGPTAGPLVVRPPEEQANHLARYINSGGLDQIEVPGLRRSTSSNGYLTLAFNDRGQLAAVEVDQEWLYAANLDRLNNALREAVES